MGAQKISAAKLRNDLEIILSPLMLLVDNFLAMSLTSVISGELSKS